MMPTVGDGDEAWLFSVHPLGLEVKGMRCGSMYSRNVANSAAVSEHGKVLDADKQRQYRAAVAQAKEVCWRSHQSDWC